MSAVAQHCQCNGCMEYTNCLLVLYVRMDKLLMVQLTNARADLNRLIANFSAVEVLHYQK